MTFLASPQRMKTREGETPGEPLISSNSACGDNPPDCPMARPPKTRICTEDLMHQQCLHSVLLCMEARHCYEASVLPFLVTCHWQGCGRMRPILKRTSVP